MPTLKSAGPISINSRDSRKIDFAAWILAARPKTLPAAIGPVLIAAGYAFFRESFDFVVVILSSLVALSLQLASNFVNDAADHERGADGPGRLGPARMAASGRLSTRELYGAAALAIGFCMGAGAPLLYEGGPIFVLLAIASILAAIGYTKGPFPLSYLGLGDLFVFIFFGLVAVAGAIYLQLGYLDSGAWLLAILAGVQTTAVIVVNNTRDREEDARNHKRTLSVLFGRGGSCAYFSVLLLIPYLLMALLGREIGAKSALIFQTLLVLTVPLIIAFYRARTGPQFNALLGRVGLHNLASSILLAGIFIWARIYAG